MKTLHDRLAPASVEELSEIVARCDGAGEKVLIVGGDTLSGMGLPPERVDLTVLTTGLNGIVRNERADLTMAALAGTPLQSITTLLATQGQFVPIDAPQPQYATLGGTLAAGWLGPRRHLYGRPRDYVIGSTVVLADGTIAKAGGMVVKNVAGYDMSRLYVGSFGTLGILAQANLKTAPMPPQARMFFAPLPEHTRARACVQLAELAIRPAAALWIEGFHTSIDGEDRDEGRIAVLLEGSAPALERATRDLRSALGRAGVPETDVVDAGARQSFERILDAYVACLGERSVTYRLLKFVQDSERSALAVHELAHRFGLRSESIVDVMNGDVILRISDLDTRRLGGKLENFDDALHDLEPHAQIIACAHPHRANLQVWGAPPAAIEKMRALKTRFDPNRTLNPGRFIGGI
ncbi:MAG: FAD-binding oxidoreductase [Candidatus Eremiobacteraeota bacterium]|nr:FAD-binding oxidoreductase [Candidatus Eremiobacteraeota bacterium]